MATKKIRKISGQPRDGMHGLPFRARLEQSVLAATATYANIHRGSGHYSIVSTHLYEQARKVVLEHLGLSGQKFVVIFCTPRRARILQTMIRPGSYHCLSSDDLYLPLGVRAMAVEKSALPKVASFLTGGGTARLVSRDWVVWKKIPERFEAGTPAILNVIAFARALQLVRHHGKESFAPELSQATTAEEILFQDELTKWSGSELLTKLASGMIGRGMQVPTDSGSKSFINLDHAASTPSLGPVWEAARKSWQASPQVQEELLVQSKSICAGFLGAPASTYDILFTSNTTEGINLVAENKAIDQEPDIEPVILNTLLEHNSNDLPWRMIAGSTLIRLSVDEEGFIDLVALETMLREYNLDRLHGKKRIRLVAISGASNVLGVFNDLIPISQIVHRFGAEILVDAAQLAAHRKIDMESAAIDYLVLSGHKVYAPFGTGVLAVKKGLLHFSDTEKDLIRKSGEENVTGIVALAKSLTLLRRVGMDVIEREEQVLTGKALLALGQVPGITVHGISRPDSPRFALKGGVIAFSLNGFMADRVAKELAGNAGIGVRYGCHCTHLLIKHMLHISPGLERFQRVVVTLFPGISLPGVTRVSLGIGNSEEDIDKLVEALKKMNPKLQRTHIREQMDSFTQSAVQRVY